MNKNSFPDWVLQHKRKGTEIRLINGKYYLYQINSKWDAKLKRSKKQTVCYLGRITTEGFIAKKAGIDTSKITILNFGAVYYFQNRCSDLLLVLHELFPQMGQSLFVSALFRLMYCSPLKKLSFYYQTSYACELWKDAHVSTTVISGYLNEIGQQRGKIIEFFQHFQKGSHFVLIDGTDLISRSQSMQLPKPGYNSKRSFKPQINALFIFAQDEKLPLYYRLTAGDIREISSMKIAIKESQLKNVVIVSDKGFYSQVNIKNLLWERLHFAIPMKRNNQLIDYKPIQRKQKSAFDGHFFYKNRPIWHYKKRINLSGRYCWLFVFVDEQLYQNEQQDYLLRVQQQYENYSMDDFYKKQHLFGTLALMTSLPKNTTAQKAFEYFKTRNEVEQMIDVFKNTLKADTSFMRNEQQMEGWMFINHLALIMYYRLYKELVQLSLIAKHSPMDVIQLLDRIFKIKLGNKWTTAEIPKQAKTISDKLNLPIP